MSFGARNDEDLVSKSSGIVLVANHEFEGHVRARVACVSSGSFGADAQPCKSANMPARKAI